MPGRNLTLDVHARKQPVYGPASAARPCLVRTQEGQSCLIARTRALFRQTARHARLVLSRQRALILKTDQCSVVSQIAIRGKSGHDDLRGFLWTAKAVQFDRFAITRVR